VHTTFLDAFFFAAAPSSPAAVLAATRAPRSRSRDPSSASVSARSPPLPLEAAVREMARGVGMITRADVAAQDRQFWLSGGFRDPGVFA
jgi:hypothetical protein